MKRFVYADNAATTKLNYEALQTMFPWQNVEYGNASQPYRFSREPKRALAEARATIAKCIGALPEEIVFTSGGTESDNWVIKGSAFNDPEHGMTITSMIEHHAVLRSCEFIEKLGFPVVYLKPSAEGIITADSLESVITEQTRMVSIMMANNEIGTIQPIKELAEIAHRHDVVFHTDAVQAVGHVPINVKDLGVDLLSASAHKFNGPKGVGFLYIRKGVNLPPFMSGGAQERGKRAGTENVASIVGMATALKVNCDSIENNRKRLDELSNHLLNCLKEQGIPFVRNGINHLPGNLSLSFKGQSGEALLHRLDLMGISVSTGSACDSVNTQISHVLKAIDLDEDLAKGTIRISLSPDNTMEEMEYIADSLKRIIIPQGE